MVDYAELRKKRQQQIQTRSTVDYASLRERRRQPSETTERIPAEPVETVVRRPQETPKLTDVLAREGYRLSERPVAATSQLPSQALVQTMVERATTPEARPSPIAQEIARSESQRVRELIDEAERRRTDPAYGQRLIDIPANIIEGAYDIIGVGTLGAAQRRIDDFLVSIGAMDPEEAQRIEDARKAREATTAYQIGQVAGYIPPGIAIERGIATAARTRPAFQNLPRAGQLAITGGLAGATEAALQEVGDVAFRERSFDPLSVAIGGAAGGVIGGATPAIERGIRRLIDAIRPRQATPSPSPTLALPEPRQRGNIRTVETPDVIATPYTFKLPEGMPETAAAQRRVQSVWDELAELNDEIRRLENRYQQAINEEYQYLKQSMKRRGGVRQGAILRDAEGNVIDRVGRISENPKWYQDFYAAYGRAPTNRELYELAKQRVDEGFVDEVGRVPSWREENNYDEAFQAYTQVRDQVRQFLKEEGLGLTDAKLRDQVLKYVGPRRPVSRSDEVSELIDELSAGTRMAPAQRDVLDEIISQPQTTQRVTQEPSVQPTTQTVEATPQAQPRPITEQVPPAPAAQQDWFTKLFGSWGVGIVPRLRGSGRNLLTTEGQIVDSPLRSTIQGARENVKAFLRNAYQTFVDMNDPLKKISMKAYEASIDAQRANQLANVIITDKFVTPEGQVVGEGLRNIVRKAGRGNYNAFTDYLILRHARTRMARGERVYDPKLNMTPEKVQERINFLESRYPNFAALGREWDQYFKNIREVYGVGEDLLSRELADVLEQQNPNYAPMRRQFTTAEKIYGAQNFMRTGRFSGQRAPIKEVSPTGSARKIVDPVRSTIEQTGAWVNAALRNRVMKEIVNKITADPENMRHIAEIIQPPKGQPNLREILQKEGEEGFLEMLQEEFNNLFKRARVGDDNVVRAMVRGEPVYIRVHDPEAVKALVGMGAENANLTMAIFNAFSNAIKQGATGALAPLFAVRGASMDVAQALIQAENPLVHVGYLFGSIFSAIGDALRIPGLRNMARNYYRAGGGYSAALRGERAIKRSVGSMRLDSLLSPRTIGRGIWNVIAAPYRVSLKIADIAENMNRIAAYNYKLRQLGGQPTPENIRQAMNYAREITVNYSRRGRASRGLEATFPYQNAAVQGMYRFVKAWKENPIKTTAMVGIGVLVPKFYEYMQFHDDPDYQRLPARERYRNIIISKNEDGTFNKIPLSPEYNALGALMVDLLRVYKDGDPDGFKGVSDALANAYTPPAISGALQGVTQGGGIEQSVWGTISGTSIGPILGAAANQAWYGGPIESMRFTDRSPSQRYDERTSAVAKWLGEHLDYSPMKIDYVLRSYGGDPARLLLPLTSEVGGGRTRETLLRHIIVDPVFTNTITDDFYRGRELLSQAYRDYQETGKELPEWYNDNLRKMVTSTAKGSVSKRISLLNEEKRKVQLDDSLSREEKSEKLREIQAEINDIMITVNARMREAGVPILNR